MNRKISRRDFLKVAGVGLGTLAFNPLKRLDAYYENLYAPKRLPQFPSSQIIARLVDDTAVRSRPSLSDPTSGMDTSLGILKADTLLPWDREVLVNGELVIKPEYRAALLGGRRAASPASRSRRCS